MGRQLPARLATAAVGIPVVLALIWWAPARLFALGILALALVAQWELYAMFDRVGVVARVPAGLLLGATVVLAFAMGGAGHPWLVPLALAIAVGGCLVLGLEPGSTGGSDWAGTALTLLGVCYCAFLLGHAVWLRARPDGAGLLLLVLAVTWCGETAAYFVGGRWGRTHLAPRVSPGKTVEGALAQLGVSVLIALLPLGVASVGTGHALGIGLTLGVLGQVGDLVESSLKRSAQVKDAGGIVPGHGGLLDRLDSLLFNVPALYYYVILLMPQGKA